jgi:hypothetical protein
MTVNAAGNNEAVQASLNLGKWTEAELDELMKNAMRIADHGSRIAFLSELFLGVKYRESTLKGGINEKEVLVVDLEHLDCFTFIEYVEALRRSNSFAEFIDNVRRVRYREGMISYTHRNHFFTDWKAFNADYIVDVTEYVGPGKVKSVSKRLNERHDGTPVVPGVSCRLREVTYIRAIYYDDSVASRLKTGDYAGIYSRADGLDVSHVGIIIKKEGQTLLRHASSVKKFGKVVDQDFAGYIRSKPGFIVFRARD